MSVGSSYEAAHRQALAEGKILIVLLAKRGDAASKEALAKIISDKNTSKLIEKKAVFVLIFEDDKQSYPIEMLYTDIFPSLFFLDKNELFICDGLRGDIKLAKIQKCLR